MSSIHSKLFARIILRSREVYVLKITTLSIAFAASALVTLFSLNEFGYDQLHKNPDSVFRILQKNMDDQHSGNRLSANIPAEIVSQLRKAPHDSLLISRIKIMNEVTVVSRDIVFRDQKVHAADPSIKDIFSFKILEGNVDQFGFSVGPVVLLSSSAARKYFSTNASPGETIKLFCFGDTVKATVAAIFNDFPHNTHEDFDVFISYDPGTISALNFNPEQTGIYGRTQKRNSSQWETSINKFSATSNITYRFQPLPEIYFGPRVLNEDARHGDNYSVVILISISGLILFLALTTFVNLTTLTLPYRSKELAVKKLAGISQGHLMFELLQESFAIAGISLAIGLIILVFASNDMKPILGFSTVGLLVAGNIKLITVLAILFLAVAVSPFFITLKFVQATPTRLLSTDTITFPKLKRVITFLQLGISIFLIIASVVVRRQINYSLVKEPGQNHDQIVYLNCPSGITNEGIQSMRSNWKKFNPNIIDVMAVSQLPDRISSKEIGTGFYSLLVDPGFREFFNFKIKEGNWFKANDGDSIIVINERAKQMIARNHDNVIGVIEDLSEQFNQPERPVKIKLAPDFNYNWLCVRVLEVDIRRTVNRLSENFSLPGQEARVHFLNKNFEDWLHYQDRLNILSGVLAIVSALLSCCAIYGLCVSLVRDQMKRIAVHKLCGAHTLHITQLLAKEFARQMIVALIIFGPVTYISLNELLRTFVYSTKFSWLDPVYPIGYCAFNIVALCGFQAMSLNRADLSSALKG
jgi:putative ABC transport system permease protein